MCKVHNVHKKHRVCKMPGVRKVCNMPDIVKMCINLIMCKFLQMYKMFQQRDVKCVNLVKFVKCGKCLICENRVTADGQHDDDPTKR